VIVQLDALLFQQLAATTELTGMDAYLVGGFVRDIFLKRNSKDIDVVVIGDGIEFAKKFANQFHEKHDFAVFKNFGTAMVKTADFEIEFVGARKESYNRDSRKPLVSPGSLAEDLSRRDFTVNALAISLNKQNYGQLLDPYNGMEDMQSKVLKTPLAPGITFDDDPLRMMRAVRFASQLKFEIAAETFEAIQAYKNRIQIVSFERITEELNKIILSDKPSIGFQLLHDSGLLAIIFPELMAMSGIEYVHGRGHKDNFIHTLQVVDQGAAATHNLWLRWAILLHDIGKPPCKKYTPGEGWSFHGHEDKGSRMVSKIFRRLKLPLNDKMKFVEKLVAMHHRPKVLAEEGVTDSAIRRLIVDAAEDLDDLFVLCKADMTTKSEEKLQRYRKNLDRVLELVKEVEERDALRNWQPPVSGEDIMRCFDMSPCKLVGEIKEQLREAILEGQVKNEREAALKYMLEIAQSKGIQPLLSIEDMLK
jgi:tRNA nucleotidyltransferase/poly(A) polymerase